MKRDAAATIFRTVVIAGAMLGAPGCGKKAASNTTPANTPAPNGAAPTNEMKPETAPKADAPVEEADPCAGGEVGGDERPRGTADEGGEMGRGFILS